MPTPNELGGSGPFDGARSVDVPKPVLSVKPVVKPIENNDHYSLFIGTFFVALITLAGVAFLVGDMIPNGVGVVSDFNVMTPDPIIEFVDVEVLVFGCPQDYNLIISTSCTEFGGLVSPLTQESLEEIQANDGVCEEQETGIVCRSCLRVEQVGWVCIDTQYLVENTG